MPDETFFDSPAPKEKGPQRENSTSRAGLAAPTAPDATSPELLPAAQLSDLRNRLPRKRDHGIAFAAYADENVRECHARAVHPQIASLVTLLDLLAAYAARARCYVPFMPRCLHNALLLFCPLCMLDIGTLRRVCRLVTDFGVLTKSLQTKTDAYFIVISAAIISMPSQRFWILMLSSSAC